MSNPLEIAKAEADDKFVITLNASEDGVIVVQSIEFIAEFARTRISLSKQNRLDQCFCPEVAAELSTILKPALEKPGMLSLPDHAIRLSDVLLEGCRVIVMAAEGGGENIIVRFRKCYGAVFSVLNDNVPLKKNLVDKSVAQTLDMLENAYIPLFDLSRYLESRLDKEEDGLEDDFDSVARTLTGKIKSLEMYNFFLKRDLETPGSGSQTLKEFAQAQLRGMST